MSKRSLSFWFPSIAILLLLATACGPKPPVETEPTAPPPGTTPSEPAPPPAVEPPDVEVVEDFAPVQPTVVDQPALTVRELNERGVLRTIYFEFDQYDLSEQARRTLRDNATWLLANPSYNIVVEGHCDERGTIDYNLALGEKRARAVREYLSSLGVPMPRMRIRSYGEERPVNPGHSESAWSQNRRAAFEIED